MKTQIIAIAVMLSSTAALANRPCPSSARKSIIEGLEKRSIDARLMEEAKAEAHYALSMIERSENMKCTYIAGVAGNIYNILTTTHTLHINFVGARITSLKVKRIRFN